MKTYVRIYSDTAPTTGYISPAISITAGKRKCTAVPFFSEGMVSRVAVQQTSGTAVDFTVEVLCSALPYPVGEQIATDPAGVNSVSVYRVIKQLTGIAGAAVETDLEFGGPFHNVDANFTLADRFIYLVIIPTAAGGVTEWDAYISGWQQMG